MNNSVLIAGKDMPAGGKFADGFVRGGRTVLITGTDISEDQEIQSNQDFETFQWNRASSISTRALVLKAESQDQSMTEAVLYFDEEYFASIAEKMDMSECSKTSDQLILGYQQLTLELLNRFEKRFASISNTPGKLVFIIKEGPNMADAIRSPVLKNGSSHIAGPLIAAAASAFTSFAENIAASYGDCDFVNIILVRGDDHNEVSKSDDQLSYWLSSYLNEVDTQKSKLTAKKSINWIKPGSKGPSAGLFR